MTQEQYKQGFETVSLQNPSEPLLPTLQKGYSRVNALYLQAALNRLDEAPPQIEVEEEESDDRENDPRWNELTSHIRAAYNEVRRIHNLYFACQNQADYIRTATQMRNAWEAVQKSKAARNAYEVGGTTEDGEEIPDNPVQLSKMLNSLRVKRKQHQDKIIELGIAGETEKLKAKESSLAKLKNTLATVEEKLKQYEY
jgi:hypothetical protein